MSHRLPVSQLRMYYLLCMITKHDSNKIKTISTLAAFLVVCIHTPWSPQADLLTRGFRWMFAELGIAVPFFFVVSGFFLGLRIRECGWWQKAIRKRFKTLLLPYIFWTGLFGAFILVLNGSHVCPRFLLKVFGLDPREAPMLGPLWYVRNLMAMVFLSPLIIAGARKCPKLIGGGVILIDMIIFPLYKVFGGEVLGALTLGWFSTHAVSFFTLGLIFARRGSLPCIDKRRGAVLAVIGVLLLGIRFVGVEVHAIQLAQFLQPIQVLIMLAVIWSLVSGSDGVFNRFSHLSFPIYVMHWFLIVTYQRLLNNGLLAGVFDSRYAVCGYVIVSVAIFILSGCLAQFIKIISPRFASIVFGGRV